MVGLSVALFVVLSSLSGLLQHNWDNVCFIHTLTYVSVATDNFLNCVEKNPGATKVGTFGKNDGQASKDPG